MIYTHEVYVNRSAEMRYGESEIEESFTDDVGTLYRALQREYGRCTGKVYITTKTEEAVPIGWTFQKREKYGDYGNTKDTYLQEVWVTLFAPCDIEDPRCLSQGGRPIAFRYRRLDQ